MLRVIRDLMMDVSRRLPRVILPEGQQDDITKTVSLHTGVKYCVNKDYEHVLGFGRGIKKVKLP